MVTKKKVTKKPRKRQVKKRAHREEVLKSTIDSPSIDKKIMTAARLMFHQRNGLYTFFEHGHWWLRRETPRYTYIYDVVDAEGYGTINGFDFELVQEDEEDDY